MTHSESEVQKKRRRSILKAVAGAPVIFTLSAGADVAAASITCKEKSKTKAGKEPPKGASSSADTWIRYRVQRRKIRIKNSNGTTSLTDKAFTLDQVPSLGSKWYQVSYGTIEDVTSKFDNTYNPQVVAGKFYNLLVDHAKYIDHPNSPELYVYLGEPVAAPIAGNSCWNSITAGSVLTTNILN